MSEIVNFLLANITAHKYIERVPKRIRNVIRIE